MTLVLFFIDLALSLVAYLAYELVDSAAIKVILQLVLGLLLVRVLFLTVRMFCYLVSWILPGGSGAYRYWFQRSFARPVEVRLLASMFAGLVLICRGVYVASNWLFEK